MVLAIAADMAAKNVPNCVSACSAVTFDRWRSSGSSQGRDAASVCGSSLAVVAATVAEFDGDT